MKNDLLDRPLLAPLNKPFARARVMGDAAHPRLRGCVTFYKAGAGTLVSATFRGLPASNVPCAPNINALHIHAGGACAGPADDPFAQALGHMNPGNCPHPAHAGDLPPLFSNRGFAFQAFYTERFTPQDILGKTVVVHGARDDFTSQPAGDSGARIGCGVIVRA